MYKRDCYVLGRVAEKLTRIACACLFLLLPVFTLAQDYGLRFLSHETAVDSRTALELSENSFCFDKKVELSFMLRFREDAKGYYGYIWRIITSGGLNIDLVFKPSAPKFRFNVIIGKRASGLSFELDSLYQWNRIKLVLNTARDQIELITPDTVLRKANAGLARDECVRIILGRSRIAGIRSIDLPPMSVRDIRLAIDGKPRHYWPLNESAGTVAQDVLSGADATVTNPEWILREYQCWQLDEEVVLTGPVSLAFNDREEAVLILSNDSLLSIPIGERQRKAIPLKGDSNLVSHGDQAVYVAWRDELININLGKKLISSFNFKGNTWKKRYSESTFLTGFWHHNKVVIPADSSLITIGGYGNLMYKNLVQRYSFNTDSWDTLALQGDFIAPRYLFGLSVPRDGVSYLIGGYGSTSGDQMLYPEHYQDIYRINWKELRTEKIYELAIDRKPFVFANSMVVENDSTFYGLLFPRFRSNSYLQLIKGSLKQPVYEMTGDSIPFYFHDIYSFADLFFAKGNQSLVAVTSFYDNKKNLTTVEIYTIAFPPVKYAGTTGRANISEKAWLKPALITAGLLLIAGLVGLRIFRRKIKVAPLTSGTGAAPTDIAGTDTRLAVLRGDGAGDGAVQVNMIRCFGGFLVRNSNDHDLTGKFTPLLKELFLLIALNTLRLGKGISASKLDELLWPDKPERSARNNRSVNIAKLKSVLTEIGPIELLKNADNWKIGYDPAKTHIDYADYLALIRGEGGLSKDQIKELMKIVGSGPLLSEVQYEWLDHFKSVTGAEITEAFSKYIKTISKDEALEHQVEVANFMSVFDPVNEEAMHLQCKAWSRMGNHTLAKNAYEKFRREYFTLYAEDYKMSFQQILEDRIPPHR